MAPDHPRFTDAAPQLTEADLTAVEAEVGAVPAELKQHYLANNGGQPDASLFETDDGYEQSISHFLVMRHRQRPEQLLLEDYYQRRAAQLSEDFIPFARDAGGNLYLLHRATGHVHYWMHDMPPEEALRTVASNLEDLLSRLETTEDFYG